MPRKPKPWFRFYTEAIRDPKLRRFSPAQRWLWAAMLAAARESTESGSLFITDGVPYTTRDLAEYAGVRPVDVSKALPIMVELKMISLVGELIVITNWPGRQFESDDVSKRVRDFRERSKDDGSNDVATLQHARLEQRRNVDLAYARPRVSVNQLSTEEQTSENRPQKRGSVDHLQTARDLEEPPPDDDEPEPLTPTQQVALDFQHWLDTEGHPTPPKAVRSALSAQIRQLLGEHIPAADILAGLKAWQGKANLGASVLPSVVHEVRSRPARAPSRRQADTDDQFERMLRRAQERDNPPEPEQKAIG